MITKKAGISEITIWLREKHSSLFYSLTKEDSVCKEDWLKVYVSFHADITGKDSEKCSALIKIRATESREIILWREKPFIHDKS